MTEDRWARVNALFQAAIDRPAAERAAFVADAAGDDTDLQREVESLIGADASDGVLTEQLGLVARPPGGARDMVCTPVLTPGTRFGSYEVLGQAGRGGMGEVYRAHDSHLNRDVALKVLPESLEADPDRLARFGREAQVLAALEHPHIAVIHGLHESGGRQALVLEFVEGPTLAERIANGPLPLPEALTLAIQIAEALSAAHRKGIVHRDLKPPNVKVTANGQAKVLDFGLAKATGAETTATASTPPPPPDAATRVGAILGSPWSTGHIRRLFAGRYVTGYDLSADDRVVAAVLGDGGESTLWLGWLDAREPAYEIPGPIAGSNPRFGRPGELVYVASDSRDGFLEIIREDGSDRRRIAAIGTRVVGTVSPDGEWVSGVTADRGHEALFSLRGRPPLVVYPSAQSSRLRWSRDGTRVYLSVQYGQASAFGTGRTYVLPTVPGSSLPMVPTGGYANEAALAAVRGVEILPYGDVGAGASPDTYVFSKITPTRHLFRITIP